MLYPFELRAPRAFYGKLGRKTQFAAVVFYKSAERAAFIKK